MIRHLVEVRAPLVVAACRATLFVVMLAAQACSSSITSPTSSSSRDNPVLQVTCTVAPSLRCTALYYPGRVDVTAGASWSAADSFSLATGDVPTPSAAVTFKTPGVPTVLSAANVYIRADYRTVNNHEPHAFAVAPIGTAVPLVRLSGGVYSGGVFPGAAPVGDATVEIIAGEGAGRRTTTLANGLYSFDFMQMNAPFTITASKAGFNPDTRSHPGIVDDAGGYPANNYLHFALLAK